MKLIKNYIIDLDDVQDDVTEELTLCLDDKFFTRFENAPMNSGSVVEVGIQIRKIGLGEFDIAINLDGCLNLACSRCLADMEVPVISKDRVKVRYGMDMLIGGELISISDQENSDYDYTLDDGVTEFDLSWSIFEVIMLAIPIQNIHPEGACDPQMVSLLQEHLAVQPGDSDSEANEDSPEGDSEEIDPRWNELKKLLNNN